MADLRPSQMETLRFATKYSDGLGAWELAEFGPGGDSVRSAESRLDRLTESGHLDESRLAEYSLFGLTDKGREALTGEQDKARRDEEA